MTDEGWKNRNFATFWDIAAFECRVCGWVRSKSNTYVDTCANTYADAEAYPHACNHLQSQVTIYEEAVSTGGVGRKFQAKKYQLNRYSALLENIEQSHAKAIELLSGLGVQLIRQTIEDHEIKYRRPL